MKIAFLGDIALFGRAQDIEAKNSGFDKIVDVLSRCDYVIGNLETPLTDSKCKCGGKSAYIKGCPRDVCLLKTIGVTHVSLANNHMFDYRRKGLDDTIGTLQQNGILWYGAYGRTEDISFDGNHLRLRGYCCYSTNGQGLSDHQDGVDLLNGALMQRDFEIDKQQGFITIASCHWGQEHVHYPNYDHVRLTRKLASEGKIIFHGHHPHVIQGVEKLGDSLAAYSLGNFCFDDVYTSKSKEPLVRLSQDNQEGLILVVEIQQNEIIGYELVPYSFEGRHYEIKESISKNVAKWSSSLTLPQKKFVAQRSDELNSYLDSRRKRRNFMWYVKRLRISSALNIFFSHTNRMKYKETVLKFINDKE